MVRRLICTAALLALAAGAAYAQVNLPVEPARRSETDLARDKAIEQRYRETVDKLPDRKQANDPWASIRPAPPQTNPPKAQKKKP